MDMNILICLNKLDIGGVETAVINQIAKLTELGHNIIVLAKKGVYAEKVEEIGAKIVEFDFQLCSRIQY